MTGLSDVVIDTGELRTAAAALRRAADESVDLRQRVPREVWGAPDWLAASAVDELGAARREIDELVADLRAEAARLSIVACSAPGWLTPPGTPGEGNEKSLVEGLGYARRSCQHCPRPSGR